MSQTSQSRFAYWSFISLMALIFSLSPFAIDMYLPALPNMAAYFQSSIDAMEASVAVYLMAFAAGQLVFGAIADSVNKARLLLVGMGVFALASIMLAYSEQLLSLYSWRAVQAFAGGSAVVVLPLIHQHFDARQSNKVISYVMACVVIAPMIAPLIGSQILLVAGWQGIFFVLAALSVATMLLQLRLLPSRGFDSANKAFSFKRLLEGYKSIFKNRQALALVLTGGSAFAGMFAFISGAPFVYIEYFSVSPSLFSVLLAVGALAMMLANIANARLLNRVSARKKLLLFTPLFALSGAFLAAVATLNLALPYVVAGIVLYMAALGLISANAISAAMQAADEHAGVLAGVSGVLQFGLGALASALVAAGQSQDATTMAYTMAACAVLAVICVAVTGTDSENLVGQKA
ncbi:multidrug effflux MFS transporter [Agaribacterium haliotis]|uniref:multidrug effflux MFS transporter n=1 Tax=Agaribacterium haliotis TaxID=2013869 RepID=UPI0019580889|nr:multidrug effflux MFS transporter [Agaribacterium haliotis]